MLYLLLFKCLHFSELNYETPTSTSSNDASQKHNLSENQPQARLWRSPGEKKCIEPITPPPGNSATLHKVDDAFGSSLVDEMKPDKETSLQKSVKSKFREKRNSAKQSTTNNTVPMALPSKLDEPAEVKLSHPEQPCITGKSLMSDSNVYGTDTLFGLLPQSSMLGMTLSDPMKLLTESHKSGGNDSILSRMKEIDGKLLELQQNKTTIEEQILKLQKEKIAVDHVTMQLQNERFLLLGSLLSGRADSNLNNQSPPINQTFVPIAAAQPPTNTESRKISVVSPNSLNKRHDLMKNSTTKNANDNDDDAATSVNPVKRILGIVDMTDDLSAIINRKRKRSTSNKAKYSHGKTSTKRHRAQKPETIVVDDHNYAESVDGSELNDESHAKRNKPNDPIELNQNSGVKQKSTTDIVVPAKKNPKNTSKDSTNHLLNSSIPTKLDHADKSPTKLFDRKLPDVKRSLSICLSPVKEPSSAVLDFPDTEDTDIISSNVPERLHKRQRGQRKITNKQLTRKNSASKAIEAPTKVIEALSKAIEAPTKTIEAPSKAIEAPVIVEPFSVKKCSVKLSRIKSSDYLLNFHGFEMSESAIVPNVAEFCHHEYKVQSTNTRDENKSSKDKSQYVGKLLGHKTPISFMKVKIKQIEINYEY